MEFTEALELLGHSRSAKRRSAAKRLRKLGNPAAGPALFAALQTELEDSRTWETQYQLIMAIAECDYRVALPFLRLLADKEFEATMVYVAIGDALVRLSVEDESNASAVLDLLECGNEMLLDGAFRAMAMLRLVPPDPQISAILEAVSDLPLSHHLRFWPAAAAAGWRGERVEHFLRDCREASRQDLAQAAALSVQGRYKNWRPL